jgi:hypothetical protein
MFSLKGRPNSGLSNAATTGSLQDPGGPRAGSTAPPSFAELRNPTLVNSKISYDTNTTASLPLLVRPWSQGYEQGFRQGSLLFVADADCNPQMCTAADLPTLNFLLENARLLSPTGTTPGDGRRLQEKILPKDLNELLAKWKFFGIMRNDMMANSMLQKLYNCDVYGRAMIANIFGSKLKRGDHVGLAVVEVANIRGTYQMYVQPDGALLPGALVKDGLKLPQIVGTVNGEVRIGMSDGTIVHRIPLGVISHAVAKVPSNSLIMRALRETDQYMLLPRIEILMI